MKHRWRYLSSCARTASVTASGRWPVFSTPMPPVRSVYSLPSMSRILCPFALSANTGVPIFTLFGMYSSRSLMRSSTRLPLSGTVLASMVPLVQCLRFLRVLHDADSAALAVQVLEVGQRLERDLRRDRPLHLDLP